jgi:hypothetical protein
MGLNAGQNRGQHTVSPLSSFHLRVHHAVSPLPRFSVLALVHQLPSLANAGRCVGSAEAIRTKDVPYCRQLEVDSRGESMLPIKEDVWNRMASSFVRYRAVN